MAPVPGGNKMKLAIDIDGTIADLVSALLPQLNKHFNTNIQPEQVTDYNLASLYNIPQPIWESFFRTQEVNNIYRRLSPIPNSVDALNRIANLGHNILILTSRPVQYYHQTEKWLLDHNYTFHALLHTNNAPKYHYARYYNCQLAIDDNPEDIYGYAASNIDCIAFAQSYNEECDGRSEHILRCGDWNMIARYIEDVGMGFVKGRLVEQR
jgi:uncharacterized HAD superfamily protein